MIDKDYLGLANEFADVFRRYSALLTEEARMNVEHYLSVAELEMACESFLLSVLEEELTLSQGDKAILLELGPALRLDKEPVFRGDFWQAVQAVLA